MVRILSCCELALQWESDAISWQFEHSVMSEPERQLVLFFFFFFPFLFNYITRRLKQQLRSVTASCPYNKSPEFLISSSKVQSKGAAPG